MRKRLLGFALLVFALLVPGITFAGIIKINAIDSPASFLGTTLTTSTGGDPVTTGSTPGPLFGFPFHVEIKLDPNGETAGTTGTRFIGAAPEGMFDITISDGATLLLALDVNTIDVTSVNQLGTFKTIVNIGGLSGLAGSDLVVAGGTLANDFGGVGGPASMLIALTLNWRATGTIFQSDITPLDVGVANITVEVDPPAPNPEPSSLLLLGLGAAGLARLRRKKREAESVP